MSASVALTSPESVAGFGLLCGRILPEMATLMASRERLSAL
jgi:phospholipase/carboxylesterase